MSEALHESSPAVECVEIKKALLRSMITNTKLRVTLAAGIAIGAADTARVLLPVEQPPQITSPGQNYTEMLTKESAVEEVIRSCGTVEDLEEFMQEHIEHLDADGIISFLSTYRQSPDDLQENGWEGCCNNLAEFTATWAYRHGGIPHIVSLCPQGGQNKTEEPWHQFVACKTSQGLMIFNNTDVVLWKGDLCSYVREKQNGKEILPVGGIIKWRQMQNDPRAKFFQHILDSVSEEEMESADLPTRAPKRPMGPIV